METEHDRFADVETKWQKADAETKWQTLESVAQQIVGKHISEPRDHRMLDEGLRKVRDRFLDIAGRHGVQSAYEFIESFLSVTTLGGDGSCLDNEQKIAVITALQKEFFTRRAPAAFLEALEEEIDRAETALTPLVATHPGDSDDSAGGAVRA